MGERKEQERYSWIFRIKEADQVMMIKKAYRELLEMILSENCQLPREELVRRFEEVKNKDLKT